MATLFGRTKGVVTVIAGSVVLCWMAMGMLHLPVVRPWFREGGGCPVGRVASAGAVEQVRRDAVRRTRGEMLSPSRPALGFELDGTSLDEVREWVSTSGLTCEEKRDASLIQCTDVPVSKLVATAEGVISDLSIGLDPTTRRVVNITAVRYGMTPTRAADAMSNIASALQKKLGAPTSVAGDLSAEHLSQGAYRTALVAYRYRDYMASVTASYLPGEGVLLREHYISANDGE